MSVQSLPAPSSIVEPAPQRRQPSEPEQGRTGEAFALPEPPREAPARREVDDKRDLRVRSDEATAEPARPARAEARTPEADETIKDEGTTPAVGQAKSQGEAPAAPPTKFEAGALVTIAAAIQAQPPAAPAGLAPEDGETPAGEQGSVAPILSELLPIAVAEAAPTATAPTETAPTEAAPTEAAPSEAAPLPPEPTAAIDAPAAVALPLLATALVQTPAATPAKTAETGVARETSSVATATPQQAIAIAAQTPVTPSRSPAGSEPAAPTEAGFGDILSAQASAKEGAGAVAQPEFKPAEFAPANQAPIDLSFLSQTRPGRLEAAIVAPPTEAAPTQASAQAAANGPAVPVHVVPIEIGLRALAGARSFDIRLDPAELGRVDVNLEISDSGDVSAKLVVDRVETLHLLQRDARTLERAFEQAGLKPTEGSVEITLRDQSDPSGYRQNRHQDDAPRRGRERPEAGEDVAGPIEAASARRLVRLGGVDLSI